MAYKCILIDHDDTVSPTSEKHHYPSFRASLKVLRPNMEITFEEYINYSFEPGFEKFLKNILQFNEEEISIMYKNWQIDTKEKIGIFYEEIKKFLITYKNSGGIIAVVTHSNRERIESDYKYNLDFIPEDIYSWELGEEKRKPNPYPIYDIMEKYGLSNEEILVIDDLKPGFLMAEKGKVDFLWAAWAYKKPQFNEYMKKHAKYSISDLKSFNEEIKKIIKI